MHNGTAQFIICIPITTDPAWPGMRVKESEDRLDAMQSDSALRAAIDATGCIHFMSMSVVWNGEDGERPYLILDITGDGTRHAVIDALVNQAGKLLLPLFENSTDVTSSERLRRFLHTWAVEPVAHPFTVLSRQSTGLPFAGTPGLSVERILRDAVIEKHARVAVQQARNDFARVNFEGFKVASSAFLSSVTATGAKPDPKPFDYLAFVRTALKERDVDYSLSETECKRMDRVRTKRQSLAFTLLSLTWKSWIFVMAEVLVFVALLLVLAELVPLDNQWSVFEFVARPIVGLWIALTFVVAMTAVLVATGLAILAWRVRVHEADYKPDDRDPDPALVKEIIRRENRPCASGAPRASNHLTAVSTIKSEFALSRVALPFAFHVVQFLSQSGIFKPGFLSNIGTIHYAQWVRIPGNKLMFLSNYDGSWESYLEDFITKASEGLTAIWSNTEGFPRTTWLFQDGAKDGDRFKRWVRRQQIPTLFWYAAYPSLTVEQIRNNADIRVGLVEAKGDTDAEEWLAKFGSAARPRYAVEAQEVQRLAHSGLRDFADGACVLVTFAGGKCNDWLRAIQADIEFGDGRRGAPSDRPSFVALTWQGLQALGLRSRSPGSLDASPAWAVLQAEFPPAFVLGMEDSSRNHLLGDTADSAPAHWRWGGPDNRVDAALLIYAPAAKDEKPGRIDAIVQAEIARLTSHGLKTACEPIRFERQLWDGTRSGRGEPFGFADGVSQPVIRGMDGGRQMGNPADVVETGEFILGYPDGRDCYPPTPQVSAACDGARRLPSLPQDFLSFTDDAPDPAMRDLGRNGSYLVIRQLKQHVDAFSAWLDEKAAELGSVPGVPNVREWLAAKLVGRWKNGAPLVHYPYESPAGDYVADNDFLLGREDPQGLRCPFGAHIRRANPRDGLNPTDPRQPGITNRHRILRRGRPYVTADRSRAEGLFFMCLNGDIERQFEFVQQTWLNADSFQGLREESDPFASQPRANGSFTIPTSAGPLQVKGLSSFVAVQGGAYFFLPSRRALTFLAELGRPPVA